MVDDLLTYEVEVANIQCDSNKDDNSKHEADDDTGYDPSDVAFTEWINTNIFDFETPMCKAFKEFNYLLQIDPDLLTKGTLRDSKLMKNLRTIGFMNGTNIYHGLISNPWTVTGSLD
ncbi:hypothetical protein Tco_1286368 [Tanacetum coccineum]